MFRIQDLTLVYGEQVIFYDASCTIQADDKIGVVGRNGAGKSTLLQILSGHQEPDEGSVHRDSKLRVAYVPQETAIASSRSVFDEAFQAFTTYSRLVEQARKLEAEIEEQPDNESALEKYAEVHERLAAFDYGYMERQTKYILHGLGFSQEGLAQPVNQLSVGWHMRILLAQQLLQEADFYLFDEPTNHLDLQTKSWFLQYLKNMQAGYLLISHSRYFLDHACNMTLEIERGNITLYTGNFTTYLQKKEELRQQRAHAKKQQDKEIARKRATIERFRAKPNKAKMAKAMERELEKMETIELEPPMPKVAFKFPPITRPGKIVLTVEDLAFGYAQGNLFEQVSFELKRGEKAALIAPNGVGKSTLFNLIAGKLPLQHGDIRYGHNVTPAYFEQDQIQALNLDNTIWQEVRDVTREMSEAKIRTFLGAFLFSGDTIHRSISALSGGEKNRVAMVKTLLQQANVLLLDEPTNHLDIYAKDVLLQAIRQYEGSVLYVSHDREFIEQTADTVLRLHPYGITAYWGDGALERAQSDMDQHAQPTQSGPHSTPSQAHTQASHQASHHLSKQERKRLQKELQRKETYIAQLEEQRNALAHQLQTLSYGDTEYHNTLDEISRVEQRLTSAEQEWETLAEKLE